MSLKKWIKVSGKAVLSALSMVFIFGFTAMAAENSEVTTMAPTDYLNVRDAAGTYGNIIGVLSPGEAVQVTGISGEWYHVKYKGTSAYAYQQYLHFEGSSAEGDVENGKETQMEATVALNVRDAASLDGNILNVLLPGDKVKVVGKTGSWYKIKYDGRVSYVYAAYLDFIGGDSQTSQEKIMVTKVGVNFRKGPSTSTEIIGGFTAGTELTITGEAENGWCQVNYKGTTGYVHSTNLRSK